MSIDALLPPQPPSPQAPTPEVRNVYPAVRRLFLTLLVVSLLLLGLFLMYQNGKSIYDNGI